MRRRTVRLLLVVGVLAALGGGYYTFYAGDAPKSDEGPIAVGKSGSAEPEPAESESAKPEPAPRRVEPRGPAAPPPESVVDGPSAREVDKEAMSWAGKDIETDELKDITSGRPYKVNVYQDPGNATVNRVAIDFDRDDHWDEKWTFKGTKVSRKVSSADDDKYDIEQVWKDGAWAAPEAEGAGGGGAGGGAAGDDAAGGGAAG